MKKEMDNSATRKIKLIARHNQTCTLSDTGRVLHVCDLDNSYIDEIRQMNGRCQKWRGVKRNDGTGVCEVRHGAENLLPQREFTAEQTGNGTLVQTASGSAV